MNLTRAVADSVNTVKDGPSLAMASPGSAPATECRTSESGSLPEEVIVSAPPERPFDSLRGGWEVFVLPYSYNRPAEVAQHSISVTVTLDVGPKFRRPPVGVAVHRDEVLGAAVPEAAIDEDGNLRAGKGDVDRAARESGHSVANPIPKAPCMEFATQEHLRGGARTELADHAISDVLIRGNWCGALLVLHNTRLVDTTAWRSLGTLVLRPGRSGRFEERI